MPAPRMNIVLALPRWFTQRPIQPMGLLYLASVLRKAGHQVRIIDGEVERVNQEAMATIVAAERPDVFGITSTTAQATRAFALAKALKGRSPETFVVLGGPHASSLPQRSLQECDALDAVVFGEGEQTILLAVARRKADMAASCAACRRCSSAAWCASWRSISPASSRHFSSRKT